MISSIFIDRPRLAIVISIVITLGGLLALSRIPVAQLPDIVPPQVNVTATHSTPTLRQACYWEDVIGGAADSCRLPSSDYP